MSPLGPVWVLQEEWWGCRGRSALGRARSRVNLTRRGCRWGRDLRKGEDEVTNEEKMMRARARVRVKVRAKVRVS